MESSWSTRVDHQRDGDRSCGVWVVGDGANLRRQDAEAVSSLRAYGLNEELLEEVERGESVSLDEMKRGLA